MYNSLLFSFAHSFINSISVSARKHFLFSLNKHVWNLCDVPGASQSAGAIKMNKSDHCSGGDSQQRGDENVTQASRLRAVMEGCYPGCNATWGSHKSYTVMGIQLISEGGVAVYQLEKVWSTRWSSGIEAHGVCWGTSSGKPLLYSLFPI